MIFNISVIIPAYNNVNYVCEAIDTVLDQTYKNYEILIIDDGSTDNTKSVLEKYNNKIRYFYQKNRGPSIARNLGIKEAKGEYIAFLDADDLWFPAKLEKQVKFLDENPDYGLVTCDALRFDNNSIITPSMAGERKLYSGNVLENLLRENFLNTNNVLIRREIFDKVGLFDENRRFSEDYDLWVRIAKHYKIGYIDEVLTKYRIHGKNRSQINQEDAYKAHLEVVFKNISSDRFSFFQKKGILAHNYFKIGYNYFYENSFTKGREYFVRSLINNPFKISSFVYLTCSFLPSGCINSIRNIKQNTAKRIKQLI